MGPDDGDAVTPLSYPGARGRQAERGFPADVESDKYGSAEDQSDFNNKSFLETATLNSLSGSLSRHPRLQQLEAGADNTHATQAYAYALPNANMLAQVCARPQPQRPATAYASSPRSTQYMADESFLLSRQTSAATMALTTSTGRDSNPIINSAHPPLMFNSPSFWRQEPMVELHLPPDTQVGDENQLSISHPQDLLDTLDHELLFPDSHHFAAQDRPSSSRSHLRVWRRNRSPDAETSKTLRGSSEDPDSSDSFDESNRPSMLITRNEYEALPPTIQRKYFSTIERSQLAHQLDADNHTRAGSAGRDQSLSPEPSVENPSSRRQRRKIKATSDPSTISTGLTRINSTDQRFFANLPEKIKRQHLTEEEQIAAHYRRQTLLSNTSTHDSAQMFSKRQPKEHKMQSPIGSPALSEGHSSLSSAPPHLHDEHAPRESEKKRVDSIYDSFRWLEEDEGLDLRLYLDDYHINLREEIPVPNKNRRPSFRRHLSINKLPFGRGSVSYNRPPIQEVPTSPSLPSCTSPAPSSEGHVRRRSRAVSLMSPRQGPSPETTPMMDPEAAHYRDPEARMKLRAFLTSPQKFDEAIEFGFPSLETKKPGPKPEKRRAPGGSSDRLRSFLEDGRSSFSEASVEDPESPKTPQLFGAPERPTHRTTESTHDRSAYIRSDASRDASREALSSREMTLRMTLTRPDLRANEDQMYGWKQPGIGRGAASREEVASPLIYARDENRKESVERQLAALDQWVDDPGLENGVVKRIWNRVRRT